MIANSKIARASAPLKWHGGKTYLASTIIERMPPHVHYVEPYFGGGAVLFQKPGFLIDDHSEVVNDIYGDLVNFWSVLQSQVLFPEFQRQVELTPFAKPVWDAARNASHADEVSRAVALFVRYRQSRQGLGRDFATMSRSRTRRGMNEQVSSWLSAIEGLPEAHERLSRVAIYNEDATKLIKQEDSLDTFFYCDPPYVPETRVVKKAYTCEMGVEEHEVLLKVLARIKGRFLLSGYPHQMYEEAAKKNGWNCYAITIDNKASTKKQSPKN